MFSCPTNLSLKEIVLDYLYIVPFLIDLCAFPFQLRRDVNLPKHIGINSMGTSFSRESELFSSGL